MIQFRPITKENYFEVIRLYSRDEDRNKIFEEWIASNCFSLVQASFEEQWTTKAIYEDDTLIGFVMHGYSNELNRFELCRFMIDAHYQNKGFGKRALKQIINDMAQQYHCKEIVLSVDPENKVAIHLYEALGFKDTNEIIPGFVDEKVYQLNIL